LTYWLVGTHGSNGAALATSVSEALTFIYFALFIRWRFG
jgi:Na+-driven multidrug efflux pump